ncbi:MAG: PRC-barrel domain-containing protein [Candidatus Kerfeldbacteria bacterium]
MAAEIKIVGLSVETKNGTMLGVVTNVDVDPETHLVTKYSVASSFFFGRCYSNRPALLIAPQQVLSITADRMVVEDMTVGETVDAGEEMQSPGVAPAQASHAVESRRE